MLLLGFLAKDFVEKKEMEVEHENRELGAFRVRWEIGRAHV